MAPSRSPFSRFTWSRQTLRLQFTALYAGILLVLGAVDLDHRGALGAWALSQCRPSGPAPWRFDRCRPARSRRPSVEHRFRRCIRRRAGSLARTRLVHCRALAAAPSNDLHDGTRHLGEQLAPPPGSDRTRQRAQGAWRDSRRPVWSPRGLIRVPAPFRGQRISRASARRSRPSAACYRWLSRIQTPMLRLCRDVRGGAATWQPAGIACRFTPYLGQQRSRGRTVGVL